jgi:hypothetical protein
MTVRREGKWETAGERLRYWIEDHGRITLVVVGSAALILLFLFADQTPSGPTTKEEGEVVRFGVSDRNWRRPDPVVIVIVRTAQGRTEQIAAHPDELAHCFRGSRIHLIRRAGSLRAARNACAPPIP